MKILLAEPRGFCAGVEHALKIAEKALQSAAAKKIYLLHEIVHNETVSADIAARGAVTVSELDEIPPGASLLISAHGVAKSVFEQAKNRGVELIDATCPLVRQVQRQAERLTNQGVTVLLFGNRKHREVEGILGQCTADAKIFVLESRADAERFVPVPGEKYAVLSQTTWNMDDVADLTALLKDKIPGLVIAGNVCNATKTRQDAVRRLSEKCDAVIVLGSQNSANAMRLKEVARQGGKRAYLIAGAKEVRAELLQNVDSLGIAGGASTPESVIQQTVRRICEMVPVDSVETSLKN